MAIDSVRRGLLLAGGGAAVAAAIGWPRSADGPLLLTACDDTAGNHYLAGIGPDGGLEFCIPVPERAHAAVPLGNSRQAVFFARRPGTLAWVVDLDTGELANRFEAAPGRHFYGHGAIGADGRLYTSENDFDRARGVIGVRDVAAGFRQVGEFPSGGTGPHQLAFLRDGRTLAVANGGIETHPERGRDKLNLPTMQPSLAYLDAASGKLLDTFAPPDHHMSLRHLAIAQDDTVVVAVQYEGDPANVVPLAFAHSGDATLRAVTADAAAWRSHRNYIASVAVAGRHALLTAPRGATASLWSLDTLAIVDQWSIRDVAGAAPGDGGFILSNGIGQLLSAGSGTLRQWPVAERLRWDNHLVVA